MTSGMNAGGTNPAVNDAAQRVVEVSDTLRNGVSGEHADALEEVAPGLIQEVRSALDRLEGVIRREGVRV